MTDLNKWKEAVIRLPNSSQFQLLDINLEVLDPGWLYANHNQYIKMQFLAFSDPMSARYMILNERCIDMYIYI